MNKDKNDLLDQTAFEPLSNSEQRIVHDGQRAGGIMASGEVSAAELARAIGATSGSQNDQVNTPNQTGVLSQTIHLNDVNAAVESDAFGGDGDLTGGSANLDALTIAPVEQNEYNR